MKSIYYDGSTNSILDLTPPDASIISGHHVRTCTRINVPIKHRGRGVGRLLLEKMLQDADEENVIITLLPVATGGLEQKDLVEWYERHRFRWHGKQYDSYMVRYPRGSHQPLTWEFGSTGEAYNATQCDSNILNGDTLHIEEEGVIGLAWTWPFAVSISAGKLHVASSEPGSTLGILRDAKITLPQLTYAVQLCVKYHYRVDPSWLEVVSEARR